MPQLSETSMSSLIKEAFLAFESWEFADSAHDKTHIQRVLKNALSIGKREGGNSDVLTLAALFHDSKNYPKGHPEASKSSLRSAEYADAFLEKHAAPSSVRNLVFDAILNHSFSRGVRPKTLEGKVLQDADRLDALGAIGIARCFAVSGERGLSFYAPDEPIAPINRPLNDKKFATDHFYQKLFCLPKLLNTETAREMAKERIAFMQQFLAQMRLEI